MIALLFVITVTCIGIFTGYSMGNEDITWFDYYRGGIIGFFISGVVLQLLNKWRSAKEKQKKEQVSHYPRKIIK